MMASNVYLIVQPQPPPPLYEVVLVCQPFVCEDLADSRYILFFDAWKNTTIPVLAINQHVEPTIMAA